MSICLSIWMSACLFICLSACLSVCLSECSHICLFAFLHVYLSVYLNVRMFVYLPLCMSICLSIWMSACSSIDQWLVSEMQRVAFSRIAIIEVCPACVYRRWCTRCKRVEMNLPVFSPYFRPQKKPCNDVLDDINVLFEGQRCESSSLWRSNMIIFCQRWLSEQTSLLPTHGKSLIRFRWVYLHLTLAYSKGQDRGHADILNISQRVTDGQTLNTSEIAYWLSIGVFTPDLYPL